MASIYGHNANQNARTFYYLESYIPIMPLVLAGYISQLKIMDIPNADQYAMYLHGRNVPALTDSLQSNG